MRKGGAIRAAAAGLGLVLGGFGTVDVAPSQNGGPSALRLSLGAPAAQAHHRYGVVRGPARRTARRVVRRRTVAGCAYYAPYYYCGGVYYRPVIHNGQTVYVSVDRTVIVYD